MPISLRKENFLKGEHKNNNKIGLKIKKIVISLEIPATKIHCKTGSQTGRIRLVVFSDPDPYKAKTRDPDSDAGSELAFGSIA